MFHPTFMSRDPQLRITLLSELSQASHAPALAPLLRRAPVDMPVYFTRYHAYLSHLPRRLRRLLQRQWRRPLAALALLLALQQAPALAATINVTTSNPNIIADGKCSLIEAIDNANAGARPHSDCAAGAAGADTIHLPANSTHTLTVVNNSTYGTGLPVIRTAITIAGHGSTIRRDPADVDQFRIVVIDSSGNLTLSETTVSGGVSKSGGGIFNHGSLTLNNSTISGNSVATIQGTGRGGGITNADGSSVILTQSIVSGNSAQDRGGGILNQYATSMRLINSTVSGNSASVAGGVYSYRSPVTITNSTISGNRGGGIQSSISHLTLTNTTVSGNSFGGGVVASYGYLTLIDSTITGNSTSYKGGGVFNEYGDVMLIRTLISGNTALAGGDEVFSDTSYSGIFTANNYNLFGHNGNAGVEGFTPGPTDLVPNKPLSAILSPLSANGGPTQTHLLVKASPAINASPNDADCAATDQRGVPRPQGAKCDIGAVEVTRCETLTPTHGCTVNGIAGQACQGTAGADSIQGTSGNDIILGLNGNDTLQGFGGNDQLCGGVGNDTLEGGSGKDKLLGGFGGDILRGGENDDNLFGGQDNDTLTGGSGADKLDGGLGTRDKCISDADDLSVVECEL